MPTLPRLSEELHLALVSSLCDPGVAGPLWGSQMPRPGTAPSAPTATHLMAILHSRDDLPEEVPGLTLAEPLPLADVVIKVASAGVLHDDHDPAAVLKHWGGGGQQSQAFWRACSRQGPHPPPSPKPDVYKRAGRLPTDAPSTFQEQ